MSKSIVPFKCTLHKNILTDDFIREHTDLFPNAYVDAASMAKLSVELAKTLNSPLVLLPFDYVAEAQAYGAELIGYDDVFGLRTKGKYLNSVDELSELPPLDFTNGRLAEIIEAIALIAALGYTPCLNITGFLSLLEILLPIEKVFAGWRKRQKVLLEFLEGHEKSLLEYITIAMDAGAKVISYSDPLTSLELLGSRNGQQIAEELVLPFFRQISSLHHSGIIHICGVSSDILAAANVNWVEIKLDTTKYYSTAIVEQARSAQGIMFFGYGCLHHKRLTKKLTLLQC